MIVTRGKNKVKRHFGNDVVVTNITTGDDQIVAKNEKKVNTMNIDLTTRNHDINSNYKDAASPLISFNIVPSFSLYLRFFWLK